MAKVERQKKGVKYNAVSLPVNVRYRIVDKYVSLYATKSVDSLALM
jgi:hypothetical protein